MSQFVSKVKYRHCKKIFKNESACAAHQRDGLCPALVLMATAKESKHYEMRAKKDAEDAKRGIEVEARNRYRAATIAAQQR